MNTIRPLFFSVILSGALVVGAFATVSYAQTASDAAGVAASTANITYPIAELGSCKDKEACKTYCDDSAHMATCVAFAEKQGLLSGESLRVSKLVAARVSAGKTPGGCTNAKSCDAYCNGNVEHLNACLAFGEELGMIPAKELAEARKIASALAKGAAMPGSCKTKGECEQYCAVGTHIDECLNFAEASGILPAEELAEARKVAPFLKNGETPGKCTTKASCDAYCADDTHLEACINFAEKAGFVSAEDAAMVRKIGGKGPGNCKGKEQCEAYCNDEAHAAECLSFAKEKGLLSEKDQADIDTGIDRLKAGLEQVPAQARPEVTKCLENAVGGPEKLARILSKQDVPTKAMGEKFQGCFANIAEIMQSVMGAQQGGGESGAPNPADIRAQVEQEMRSGAPSGPAASPSGVTGSSVPAPAGSVPSGAPSPTTESCAAFASAPSCDYVPSGVARDLCVKCKAL
ncbi:MAG: hypothetical protein WCT45_00645 [Candidatus Paceibacterota bacterium]|jgi:hypothetical protein